MRDFYAVPKVAEWIDSKALEDDDFEWLKSELGMSPIQSQHQQQSHDLLSTSFDDPPHDDELTRSVVIVSGAGMCEVNGIYSFHSLLHDAGMYRRTGKYQGQEVEYSLYRCKIDSWTLRWFISIVPDGCEPGNESDLDFYFAPASQRDGAGHVSSIRPPTSRWQAIEPKYDPAPSVTCTYDASDDSDKEDSMAVAEDEDLFVSGSLPDTPESP